MQLFVVQKEDKCYVFDNHDAALKCRQELKLKQDKLWGCVVFREWNDGQPQKQLHVAQLDRAPPSEGGRFRFES